MEVGDGLAGVLALVDHEAVSVFEFELVGDGFGGVEDMEVVAGVGEFGEAGDFLAGDDQDVDGGLGLDVAECDDVGVFVDNVGGDFAVDDFGEEGHGVLWFRVFSGFWGYGGFGVTGVLRPSDVEAGFDIVSLLCGSEDLDWREAWTSGLEDVVAPGWIGT